MQKRFCSSLRKTTFNTITRKLDLRHRSVSEELERKEKFKKWKTMKIRHLIFLLLPPPSLLNESSESRLKGIENRIYIRGEFKESLGMNIFSPFQPEREFKVYKSCECSQIMCTNTVCSLDYSFQFRIF